MIALEVATAATAFCYFHWSVRVLIVSILVIVPLEWFLFFPFRDCERFARARIRRKECVSCGANLEPSSGDFCPACDLVKP